MSENTQRKPRGSECECTMCGRFFTSESAFNAHLNAGPKWDCNDPLFVLYGPSSNYAGFNLFKVVDRKEGPTWTLHNPGLDRRAELPRRAPSGHPEARSATPGEGNLTDSTEAEK